MDFYPRPPRGGRRPQAVHTTAGAEISIHALREEGDQSDSADTGHGNHFYPRPPRGGRLNTLKRLMALDYISIHALREEGDIRVSMENYTITISIHALREEGDPLDIAFTGATNWISIHALREEGDLFMGLFLSD